MLYRKPDVPFPDLFQEDMKRWWDPKTGRQKQLAYFSEAGQLISFDKELNSSQVKAIAHFAGWEVRKGLCILIFARSISYHLTWLGTKYRQNRSGHLKTITGTTGF